MKENLRQQLRGLLSAGRGFIAAHLIAGTLACFVLAAGCAKASLAPKAGTDVDAAAGSTSERGDAGDAKADAMAAPICSDAGGASKGKAEECSCNNECRSGYCVGGVCCDSACTDGCKACNLPSSLGTCAFVPSGVKSPDPDFCVAETPATCGQDGTCDGAGACRKYEDGTLCKNGVCDGDGVVNAKACDGKGSCTVDVDTPCAPYSCDPKTSQCAEQCSTNALCAAGQTCSASRCGFKLNGFKCSGDDDCASGHCADGYCCNVACSGACLSCKEPGAVGRCKLIGAGVPDSRCLASDVSTCGTTGLCDGAGACDLFPENTPCAAASCASSATQNTARVCDGQGTCRDAQLIDCSPFLCSKGACKSLCLSDADCEAGHQCVITSLKGTTIGSCGKKKPGVPCTDPSDCESNQCVDGVCCESACSGACRSCSLPGSPGQCASVAAGAVDPRSGCKDLSKESCGTNGLCDGSGGCQMYPAGTVCGTESCVQGAYTPAATCNQSGQCVTPPSLTCNPFICNGSSCFVACSTVQQCVSGNLCVNGSCGLIPNGGQCSTGKECQSGHCAQGVCCNSDCTDACMACDLASSAGKCTAVADNSPDPQEKCKVTLQNTCGTTGSCKAGACANWDKGKNCSPAACATSSAATPASACNGAGQCVTPSNIDCGKFVCSSTSHACNSGCKSDADCKAPNTCAGGSCGLKSNGAACSAANQCESGVCTEGVCCDSACSEASTGGLCMSCKVAGNVGKCSFVASGQSDPKQRCAASKPAAGDCSNNGTCNGNGACRPWSASTGCRNASCPSPGSAFTPAANCDGAGHCCDGTGHCPPSSTPQSCSPYVCDSKSQVSCLTTCSTNADCVVGETCRTVDNRCGNKLALGQTCAVGSDCDSGNCVNSTCCGTASCDDKVACTTDSCATSDGTCKHTASAGSCLIGGSCYSAGAINPANLCQVCAPATSTTAWSPGNAGTVCRAAAGACDVAGKCTGLSGDCPADSFAPSTTVCRASAGVCDVAETCSGASIACPADAFASATKVCRASTGACDVAEKCTGESASCPTDGFVLDGTLCSDGNACTASDQCTGGLCAGTTYSCNDNLACTTDSCDGSGGCTHTPTAKNCFIGGACYASGATDPSNSCQVCKPGTTQIDWSDNSGASCSDDACLTGKTCSSSGKCGGGKAVTCKALDQCHVAGTCDSKTGCSNPVGNLGMACKDQATDPCCKAGLCIGVGIGQCI